MASPGPSRVTPGDLWALVGAILLATFSLGIAIGWIRLRAVRGAGAAILQSGKWERLVGKACALSTVGTPYPWPSGITSIIHWAHHPGLRRGRVSTPARIPWTRQKRSFTTSRTWRPWQTTTGELHVQLMEKLGKPTKLGGHTVYPTSSLGHNSGQPEADRDCGGRHNFGERPFPG